MTPTRHLSRSSFLRWAQCLLPIFCGLICALTSQGQITIPDRLPNGLRMPTLATPADAGILPYDTLRTLPEAEGGRDTWWHRHALYMDGPVEVAMDPVVEIARDFRQVEATGGPLSEQGHRNIRGVRYAGHIDNKVRFGGKVLEMQRLLVGPETEYILAAGAYPGMGTGKLRPAENGLYTLDHSLAEVWFDARPSQRVRLQWGLGSTSLGPGSRNILWNGARAPAPFLLVEIDLGKGWTWRWVQSRQRGRNRLPADGAREGRYHPLGLGLRSITKTVQRGKNRLDISLISARWTDALNRGTSRNAAWDWALGMAPWHVPNFQTPQTPWYLAGHSGLDIQWRRPHSTWYGQVRTNPANDDRYDALVDAEEMDRVQFLMGHVRQGEHWTVWTEWAPHRASTPEALDPNLPVSPLGIQPWSALRPTLIQGEEFRLGGLTLCMETSLLPSHSGTTHTASITFSGEVAHKVTLHFPTRSADAVNPTARMKRGLQRPNRWGPPLVPLTPFVSGMHILGTGKSWWSFGISSPVIRNRKSF